MDDIATIVISASAVIVILQIILLALVLNIKSKLAGMAIEKKIASETTHAPREPRRNQRPSDRPRQGRNQPPRQPSAPRPQENDPTDKSLRDINLRLKNAERDQEKARRRVQESLSNKREPREPRERGNRREDFRRPRRGGERDRRPNSSRSQRFKRGGQPAPSASAPPAPPQTSQPEKPAAPPEASQAPNPTLEVNIPNVEPPQTPNTEEQIQHGRFTGVKRRVLKNENETGGDTGAGAGNTAEPSPAASTPEPAIAPRQEPESPQPSQPDSGTDIAFGRR